jgi:hypothetical protein
VLLPSRPSESRQALEFAECLLIGADDAEARVPRKDGVLLCQELNGLRSVALGDLGIPDSLGDTRLDQQDVEQLDRKQTGRSRRDEITKEVDRLLIALLPAGVDEQLGQGESGARIDASAALPL